MRPRVRCIAVGLLFAGALALDGALGELGAVPVAHAQRWRPLADYQSPLPNSETRSCGAGDTSLFIFLCLMVVLSTSMTKDRRTEADDPAEPQGPIDVTVLRVAVDWRERKFLESKLDDIGRNADMSSAAGLVRTLREVTLVLRRARDTWLYAGAVNAEPMHAPEADEFFEQHASAARDARMEANSEGLAVITLIVAAHGHLLDFHDLADAEQVRRCLESLGSLTSADLTAVEVVWTPASEQARLSADELARLFPDMQRIRGSSDAGRIHCASCAGPFPAELSSCPHCGARVSEQASS
jgi:uncharacterized membrane protein